MLPRAEFSNYQKQQSPLIVRQPSCFGSDPTAVRCHVMDPLCMGCCRAVNMRNCTCPQITLELMGNGAGDARRKSARVFLVACRAKFSIWSDTYCLGRGPDGICIGMQKQVPEEKRQPKTHEPSRLHSRGSEFPLCNLMQGNVRMSSK